jgi:hypothetical protein
MFAFTHTYRGDTFVVHVGRPEDEEWWGYSVTVDRNGEEWVSTTLHDLVDALDVLTYDCQRWADAERIERGLVVLADAFSVDSWGSIPRYAIDVRDLPIPNVEVRERATYLPPPPAEIVLPDIRAMEVLPDRLILPALLEY